MKNNNEKLISLGRNVDMRDSVGGHSLSDLFGYSGAYGGSSYSDAGLGSKTWTIVKRWREVYHSNERSKVVDRFGEKRVQNEG